jgi:hypothetical protein
MEDLAYSYGSGCTVSNMGNSVQKELRYQGSANVVSLILHVCNKTLGFPVDVKHGTAANVYAEYQFEGGLCTLFTRSTKDLYHITIHFKPVAEAEDAVTRKMSQVGAAVSAIVGVPDFLSVFFLAPEDSDGTTRLADPNGSGNDARPSNPDS